MRGTGAESLVVVMKSLSWRWSEGATSGGLVRIQLRSPGGDADEGNTICPLQAGTAACQVCSPDGSGMSREVHVPFYERLGVPFPRPTHRFRLSRRDAEDLLAERGVIVLYEVIRLWCITFGAAYARRLKRRQGRLGDTWHLDEVFVTIQGRRHYFWRAVDQDGDVLDILVQSHRDCRAATRFFRKLLEAFGIEGTGSYGAGLARAVHRAGHHVVEVNRGDRRTRRAAGKSDTIDAEVAARSLLAGQSTAIPKTADGAVEMIRQLKITRDTAMKARTTAMNTLKQIIVQAPPVLREALHDLTDHGLFTRCAGLRPGPIDTPIASAKHTLRSLARRWMALAEEIALHDQHLARLTTATSPTLCEGFGVGAHTAAELLIIFGDNPDRIRSEAAFAKLCGACPIPASSGMTTGRHRLNRGGHRHANAALYRAVIVRMQFHQPTRDYVARRLAAGRTKRVIIRCLKRFLAREIYQRVMTDFRVRQEIIQAA